MNENRMKTSVNTGEVSLLPVPGAGWGVKIVTRQASVTEMLQVLTWKLLEVPSDERILRENDRKNSKVNHEHQLKWEIPDEDGSPKLISDGPSLDGACFAGCDACRERALRGGYRLRPERLLLPRCGWEHLDLPGYR
jgi:hypothetical protein